ncbi:MAG TPA: hypothetical protein VHT34_04020, partial [Clostridia bacterium]|nr:hypothetical protein [Clostridia bacterium]
MLKLPNLDDRTFEELVDDAKKLISRYAPEWTDHNIHDPGITFLELFAWLTEMQQYYLDTITDESYLKFLKLFGVKPYIAEPAKTDVSFKTGDFSIEERCIPEGTKLLADNIVFETAERLQYTNLCLEQIISEIDGKYVYYTEANTRDGIFYNPFGISGSKGNKLYLGFSLEVSEKLDRLPQSVLASGLYETRANYDSVKQTLCFKGIMSISEKDSLISISSDEDTDYRNTVEILYRKSREPFANITTLALTFDIFEDYLKSREKPVNTDETTLKYSWDKPLGELVWEYFTKSENGAYAWSRIETDDTTNMLFKNGRIYFKIPPDIQPTSFPGAKDDFCWIRARVVNDYVLSPKVDKILLNAVQALQKETLVDTCEFGYENDESLVIEATHLSLTGKCILQVQQDELWEDWIPVNDFIASEYNDRHYKLTADEKNCMLRLAFGDGVHGKKPERFCKIRLIFFSQEYENKMKLGVSSGLPGQVYKLDRYPVMPESFRLQAPVSIKGSLFWQDYTRVDSL